MGKDTKIEWADHTMNFWWGCTKVSPACQHCYAETLSARFGRKLWGPGVPRMRTGAKNWMEPYKWNKAAKERGEPQRVFTNSMADFFDAEVDPQWRADALKVIEETPHLIWMILTKRPELIRPQLEALGYSTRYTPCPPGKKNVPQNVWIGTTAESQAMAEKRLPDLLGAPFAVQFLSIEPLLGPIDLTAINLGECGKSAFGNPADCCCGQPVMMNAITQNMQCDCTGGEYCESGWPRLSWVIVGGESGAGARPMNPTWVRSLRDQCNSDDIPFFFKQWGSWAHDDQDNPYHVGKAVAGRELDGRTWDELPAVRVGGAS